jgi:uncharacterized membrane protein YheB (UPF0754 family)
MIFKMKRFAPRSQPVNSRLIYYVLIVGFALLLSLIWDIGRFSANKLGELSRKADLRAQDYTSRLKLAIEIRAQTETVIAEARYSNAMHELRIGGPPFNSKLNAAQVRLEKLLDEAQKVLAQLNSTLPHDDDDYRLQREERTAWQHVENSAAEFWQILRAIRQRTPESKGGEDNVAGTANGSETENKLSESAPDQEAQRLF